MAHWTMEQRPEAERSGTVEYAYVGARSGGVDHGSSDKIHARKYTFAKIGVDLAADSQFKWSYDRVKEWIRQMRETLLDRRVHAYQEMYVPRRVAFTIPNGKAGESFSQGNPCRQQQQARDSNDPKQEESYDVAQPSFYYDSGLIATLSQQLLDFNPAI